jgi:phage tail sheath gpL-like
MISSHRRSVALAAAALLSVLAGGCTDQPPAATGSGNPGAGESGTGAVDVALAVPPKLNIATINYQLTNTGYSKSGTFDVSQTQTLSAVVGGIPAGTGYTLAMSATDTANKFTGCTGSSSVNVVAGATTPVSVAMDCHLPQQVIVSTPNVPVPMSAVVLLAAGLLAAGLLTNGRRGERRPFRRE